MKLNISSPANGTQKALEIEDERKLAALYDKRLSQEIPGEVLGDQFKGYIFKITGGSDKQGFPMKQGVLVNSRVKLLLSPGTTGYCAWRARAGERRRKTVRGCIVGPDIAALSLVVMKQGDSAIEGLTDTTVPRRLGPKRASKIRKLFNLTSQDDVRKFVVRRPIAEKPAEGDKPAKKARSKAPKIQRLVTAVTLQRRRRKKAMLKARHSKAKAARDTYQHKLAKIIKVSRQRAKARDVRKAAKKGITIKKVLE
eukprot:NODE_860_length_1126_cov_738.872795_g700_i0.p2 GENE.NODE_860_length_1126_cov_738.872795_g700_i0~~NODE_860_length_1126_cov_738.872795_g700_i0.p2  ORF type:complete len:254 (+),score=93.73 NODE_860_length_1126_cov_738.872795_g700_i0:55-816(+)